MSVYVMLCAIWYYLCNLENVEKTHIGKHPTLLKVPLLHGCFSCLLNCTNGAKLCNASDIYLKNKDKKTASKIDAPTLHHKADCKKVKIVQCKHICKHWPLQSSGCVFIPCFQFFSGSALNCYLSNKGHATIFENVDQITHFVLALRYRWSVAT